MKRFLLLITAVSLVLCSCSNEPKFDDSTAFEPLTEQTENYRKEETKDEIRGIWISCFELPDAAKGEEKFKKDVKKILDNVKNGGFNTIFLHVRAFADSIYPSQIFPWSKYCCKGKNPNFDPLKIIVDLAQHENISVHAWINPFRISSSDDVKSIPESSPAKSMLQKNSSDVVVLSNGIYFNPASPLVHALIYKGVREILENYNVEGIHIDDYFYPATDEKIDEKEYNDYKKLNGKLSLCEWRKNSVSAFVAGLYEITKEYSKQLSISPSGNLEYNEEKMYADIDLWMNEKGYADIIIPQIYYGFNHEKFPFINTAQKWASIKKNGNVKLLCGVAQYKVKKEDLNAGDKGRNEWIDNKNIIENQIKWIQGIDEFNGFVVFSYSYSY